VYGISRNEDERWEKGGEVKEIGRMVGRKEGRKKC
jgi:hypothetical protein